MNILLLGGTGAMGGPLSKILSLNDDNNIYITTRKNRISEKENISFINGDAHNDVFLEFILSKNKWDVIVDFMVYNTEEFKSRVDRLLESCGQYIFLSSARVYASVDKIITENSPRLLDVSNDSDFLKTDEYALKKARQENVLFGNIKKNWTIIRPYITYNENRLQLGVLEKEEWLYLAMKTNYLIFSKDLLHKKTTLTYGYDVSLAISQLIGNPRALSEVFHITGAERNSITWEECLNIYLNVLKKNNINPTVILDEECYRIKLEQSKYQVIYDRYYDRLFDNSKINSFISSDDFTKPEIGLSKCLETFLINPYFSSINIYNIIEILKNKKIKLKISQIDGLKNKLLYLIKQ